MKSLVLVLFVCVLAGSFDKGHSQVYGGGGYAYQDSNGNRYSGSYKIKDGKVIPNTDNDKSSQYNPNSDKIAQEIARNVEKFSGGADDFYSDFFPKFFGTFESRLQQVFQDNLESQRLAFSAAQAAFEATSQNFGNMNFNYNPFNSGSGFGSNQNGFGNSAFAMAAVGPNSKHQVASINPANPVNLSKKRASSNEPYPYAFNQNHNSWMQSAFPAYSQNMPNIDMLSPMSDKADGKPHYHSVSSSSYSTSMNVDGKEVNHRGAESVVNKDGVISKFNVRE